MKKKIKDLTQKDSDLICANQGCCEKCPLYGTNNKTCTYGDDSLVDYDKEVEIPQTTPLEREVTAIVAASRYIGGDEE